MSEVRERLLPTGFGALQVYERGSTEDGRPTLVFTHGWPDSHEVWNLVADRLEDRFHLVAFDTRGVGRSTKANVDKAYTLDKLASDVDAVVAAVSPDRLVHLVGHDWGSVQGWELLSTPAYAERVASFTSVSGPCLDHIGASFRSQLRNPTLRSALALLSQALKSAYTVWLSLPVVGTLMWRLGFTRGFRRWLAVTEGVPFDGGYPGPGLAADAIAAVPIYRQNILSRMRRPNPRIIPVPVQLIVNTKDPYVSPRVFEDIDQWVPDLTRRSVRAGHWAPRTHPDELAELIAAFVDGVEARPQVSQRAGNA